MEARIACKGKKKKRPGPKRTPATTKFEIQNQQAGIRYWFPQKFSLPERSYLQ